MFEPYSWWFLIPAFAVGVPLGAYAGMKWLRMRMGIKASALAETDKDWRGYA